MCRFAFYLGRPISVASLVTDPVNSLIHQSYEAKERFEPLNGDGFGLAWYVEGDPKPARFRSVTPAWSNSNLLDLARVTRSRCILAHVRAATQGLTVQASNCHPFRRGELAFMHNGDVGGFEKLRRALLNGLTDRSFDQIRGSTDSEHLFALICDRLDVSTETDPLRRMVGAMREAIARVRELQAEHAPQEFLYLNLVLSDGVRAVAARYTTDAEEHADSLYLHRGRRYVCEDGLCHMVAAGADEGAVIVASEPLSEDEGWEKVPVGSFVTVGADLSTNREAVGV